MRHDKAHFQAKWARFAAENAARQSAFSGEVDPVRGRKCGTTKRIFT
jgi:hypothetical protein